MYSQHNEEMIIGEFFAGRVGRFLDLAAFDGRQNSNTLRLVELGWSGVCVEPSPAPLAALIELHRHNPRIQIVNACIAGESKLMPWYDSRGDGVSTLVPAHAERWSKPFGSHGGTDFANMLIKTTTVGELLEAVGRDFDLVSLDVESLNFELLIRFPWAEMKQTRLICIEPDGKEIEMATYLVKFGFTMSHHTGGNTIYSRSI